MPDRLMYYHINPENYTGLQPGLEVYPQMLRRSPTQVLATFYGHYLGQEQERGRITVTETQLRNGETIYRVESQRFPVNAVFTTYEGKENIKVQIGGRTYYENTCVFCGGLSTGFEPLEQEYVNNAPQPYVCPTCQKRRSRFSFQKLQQTLWKHRGVTALEQAIESILMELQVPYEAEYPLTVGKSRAIYDFYVPCANILIEGEGMAFHTPAVQSKLESSADALIRNTARDMVKIAEAIRHGYYVYVIFEADIVDIKNRIPLVKEENINRQKYDFLKNDLAQLLTYRGCRPYQEPVVFKSLK